MSPKTRATRPCAAPCFKIELEPSRLAGAAGVAWLLLACGGILGAAGLPLALRLAACLLLLIGSCRALAPFVWLWGTRAVRVLEGSARGELYVHTGKCGRRLPAIPAPGCQRVTGWLWILRFETPDGCLAVLIDASIQDPVAIRRLSRRLGWRSGRALLPSGPKV
jgi:hypothetical protein